MTLDEHKREMNDIRKLFEVEEVSELGSGTIIPIPKNETESIRQFKDYICATMCCSFKYHFYLSFDNTWNVRGINDEIKEYERFIANAKTKILKEAIAAEGRNNDTNEYCYLRLEEGFYPKYGSNGFVLGSKEALVYSRYFLFYDFLKAKLFELEQQKIVAEPITPITSDELLDSDKYKFIRDTLKPLSGKWTNEMEIMSDTDFRKILSYTAYIIDNNKLPEIVNKISRTQATAIFIRYSFFLINKNYSNAIEKKLWCEFIKLLFSEFDKTSIGSLNSVFHKPESYKSTLIELNRVNKKVK